MRRDRRLWVTVSGTVLTLVSTSGGGATDHVIQPISSSAVLPLSAEIGGAVAHLHGGGAFTRNQASVAADIDRGYAPGLVVSNPEYTALVSDLFNLDDAGGYAVALDQLSADLYAGYLRSATLAGARFNGMLQRVSACGTGATQSSCLPQEGAVKVWLTGNYGEMNAGDEGDSVRFKAEQYYAAGGVDVGLGSNFVLGVAGGYLENRNTFDRYDGTVDARGWQAGVYGRYDSGKFYAKGALSYSELDGDARRAVDFSELGMASTAGFMISDPDVNVWAASAEMGVRLPLGEKSTVTPYVAIDYAQARLKRFTEEGVSGAALTVQGKDEFLATELGVELQANFGGIAPYVRAGWQHNFADDRAGFHAAFVNGPPSSGFDVVSDRFAPDAGVVEVGLNAQLGENFNARLGYRGRFSDDLDEHSGGLTLSYRFGGESFSEKMEPSPKVAPAPRAPRPQRVAPAVRIEQAPNAEPAARLAPAVKSAPVSSKVRVPADAPAEGLGLPTASSVQPPLTPSGLPTLYQDSPEPALVCTAAVCIRTAK